VGFLTFDNLLQVLTGRIKDAFHFTAEDVMGLPEGSFLLKGTACIYALERILVLDLSSYPVSIVIGLMLHKAKSLPPKGAYVNFERFALHIEKREDPKHIWVRGIPKPKNTN